METVPKRHAGKAATTIRDVAQRAGVGIGTVSRVLNGGVNVRGVTRDRVHQAIQELGFRPSPAAQALSRGRASTIGVTAPHLTRPSVVERLRGVVETLGTSTYDLGLATVETGEQRERRIADLCQRHRVDGAIIISLSPTADEATQLRDTGVPTVVVDAQSADFPSIVIDDVVGGRIATEHLLTLGHRRIAFLGDAPEEGFHFTSSDDRQQGYLAALADAGVERNDGLIVLGEHSRAVAMTLTTRLLSMPRRPTAIFASSDTQALGVLEAARSLGIDVPGDLSVIGFDDLEIASFIGLSTVRQPLFETGKRAAELLLETVDSPAILPASTITLDLDLIPRETTGRPRSRASRARPTSR